jgi:hypothetical protein
MAQLLSVLFAQESKIDTQIQLLLFFARSSGQGFLRRHSLPPATASIKHAPDESRK